MDVLSSARPSSSRAHASSARPSSSGARGSSSRTWIDKEEEEEETDEEADPDYMELGASRMEEALEPTQPSQPSEAARRASSRISRRPGWQNTPEGYIRKGKMAAKRGKK